MKLQQIHLKVSGRVQGVGFRQSTLIEAQKLQLVGSVRNTEDGSVEIMAEGATHDIERLREWCHLGPVHARVEKVDLIRLTEIQMLTATNFIIHVGQE